MSSILFYIVVIAWKLISYNAFKVRFQSITLSRQKPQCIIIVLRIQNYGDSDSRYLSRWVINVIRFSCLDEIANNTSYTSLETSE